MKKLFGFTLAEVLITMGIVGVVAAITTPVLVANIQRQAYSATAKTTVGDLENALSTVLAAEQVDSLFESSIWANGAVNANTADKDTFINALQRYLKIDHFENINASTYYTSHGTNSHEIAENGGVGRVNQIPNGNGYFPVILKSGVVVFISINEAAANGIAGWAWIDVNATEPPNTYGRDILSFAIIDDGRLAPIGSQLLHDRANFSLWNTAGCCPRNGVLRQGVTCTARLVENNYNFDY